MDIPWRDQTSCFLMASHGPKNEKSCGWIYQQNSLHQHFTVNVGTTVPKTNIARHSPQKWWFPSSESPRFQRSIFNIKETIQEISNRTHGLRTTKPEYLIALARDRNLGVDWFSGPTNNFLMAFNFISIFGGRGPWVRPLEISWKETPEKLPYISFPP